MLRKCRRGDLEWRARQTDEGAKDVTCEKKVLSRMFEETDRRREGRAAFGRLRGIGTAVSRSVCDARMCQSCLSRNEAEWSALNISDKRDRAWKQVQQGGL